MNKGNKVCRDENFAREPSLQDALAYEAIYGLPVEMQKFQVSMARNIEVAGVLTNSQKFEKMTELNGWKRR
jgi:hypothetical protein